MPEIFTKIIVGPHGQFFFAEASMGPKEMMQAFIGAHAKCFGFRPALWQQELDRFEEDGTPKPKPKEED